MEEFLLDLYGHILWRKKDVCALIIWNDQGTDIFDLLWGLYFTTISLVNIAF